MGFFPSFQHGEVSLYIRVASVLRAKILAGDWPKGQQLPTISEFCEQFGVARVTVRQALQLLAREGLVSCHRGKGTFVTYRREKDRKPGLVRAIDDSLVMLPDHEIRILHRERTRSLPASFDFHEEPFPEYVRVRKVHVQGGVPYSLMDLHVAAEAYDTFPPGADAREKVVRLILDHSKLTIASARQIVTVGNADFEVSRLLEYPMAAAVAHIDRVLCDSAGRVLFYGAFTYRGDRFSLEMDVVSYIKQTW